MRNKVSSWVRQSKHRAKKRGVASDMSTGEVNGLIEELGGKCAYCGGRCTTLDHPFPVGDGAPNVMANVLPCCGKCKEGKGNMDIIAYSNAGKVPKDRLLSLIASMLGRRGGILLKEHIKSVTGIGL